MTSPTPTEQRRALLDGMLDRRSVAALEEPGPTAEQVHLLLRAAATVPDHGSLRPWRFVVVAGDARRAFGDALVSAALERQPDLPPGAVDKMRGKAFVAPAQVVIVASPRLDSNVAAWEQEASAACTGFAITLAAHALGLGAVWKSAPFRRGGDLDVLFELHGHEHLLGWVNVGTVAPERASVDRKAVARAAARDALAPADIAAVLTPEGLAPLPSAEP